MAKEMVAPTGPATATQRKTPPVSVGPDRDLLGQRSHDQASSCAKEGAIPEQHSLRHLELGGGLLESGHEIAVRTNMRKTNA
jgi:hypothetical protein